MIEKDIRILEGKIDKLIVLLQKQKFESIALRKEIEYLKDKNFVLSTKQVKAVESLRSLILQLKDALVCQIQK